MAEGWSIEVGQINGIHIHLTGLEILVRYFIYNFYIPYVPSEILSG